jgi:hypothetical protein
VQVSNQIPALPEGVFLPSEANKKPGSPSQTGFLIFVL